MIIKVRMVEGVQQAIDHIEKYGTHHSDGIVTNDMAEAQKFKTYVDSACVDVNASTRFTDGFCLGLGAEMGISTGKLHARGPIGLKELTTIKYLISGNGQTRD
jgi:glutamate-5-semialdehyde dehydrogenase